LSFVEVKLNEIKSLKIIMGSIKRNWKNKDSNKICESQIKNPKWPNLMKRIQVICSIDWFLFW
jgi:hypothetical protein